MVKYIAFEGIDGCGKTAFIKALEEKLTEGGNAVLVVKEPWRFIISDSAAGERTVASKFLHDRVQLHERLRNLAPVFDYILSDRCLMSTLVYNSTEEHDMDAILVDHYECLFPDRIIWFDINPVAALERAEEESSLPTLERLSRRYLTAARKLGKQRVKTILDKDCSGGKNDLMRIVWAAIHG